LLSEVELFYCTDLWWITRTLVRGIVKQGFPILIARAILLRVFLFVKKLFLDTFVKVNVD